MAAEPVREGSLMRRSAGMAAAHLSSAHPPCSEAGGGSTGLRQFRSPSTCTDRGLLVNGVPIGHPDFVKRAPHSERPESQVSSSAWRAMRGGSIEPPGARNVSCGDYHDHGPLVHVLRLRGRELTTFLYFPAGSRTLQRRPQQRGRPRSSREAQDVHPLRPSSASRGEDCMRQLPPEPSQE